MNETKHAITSKCLGDYASYGMLTGKRIRGLKSDLIFKITGVTDTPTGLVISIERQNMTPLERTECQVTTIPWAYRDNYAVIEDKPNEAPPRV
jgi:hypothetical protein